MSGGSSTPVAQTTTAQPSKQQKELINLAMPGYKEFAANPPQYYPGETVAPFDPSQVAGQEQVLGAVPTQQGIVGGAADANQLLTSGKLMYADSNPYLQSAIQAASQPTIDALLEQMLPSIRAGATGAGQYGSSRQGIAESRALRDSQRNVGDIASKLAFQGYGQGLDALIKGVGLAPQTATAQTIPGATTSAVGDVRQGQTQAELGGDIARYNYEQQLPLLTAKELAAAAAGLPGGSTTTTATTPQANPVTASLGGAAAGATLGSALMPGIGTVAGAGIGGLLPWIT
jgi:hypothetical protein